MLRERITVVGSTRSPILGFSVLALILALVSQVAAADVFAVQVKTSSISVIEGLDHVQGRSFVYASRILPGSPVPKDSHVAISGFAENATVHRFEVSWKVIELPAQSVALPLVPTESITSFARTDFRLKSTRSESAIIVVADRLDATADNSSMRVTTVATDPWTGGPNPNHETYGAAWGPNETGHWMQRGSYVVAQPDYLKGNVTGKLRFYWFQGSVVLDTPNGSVALESKVWDERPANALGSFVRHIVWHEIRAADSKFAFLGRSSESQVNSVMFARTLEAQGADVVSLSVAENMTGSLPPGTGSEGPSLWIRGQIGVEVAPDGQSPFDASNRYRMEIAGQAAAYSLGGGGIIPWGSPATLGVASLLLLLAATTFLFRDGLAEMASRAWIGLYSRLSHDKLLDNDVRGLICNVLGSSPGLSFLDLRQAIGTRGEGRRIGIGTLTHHVAQLQRFGLVASRKFGNLRCYYLPKDRAAVDGGARLVLRSNAAQLIARTVLGHPGLALQDLHDRIGLHRRMSKSTLLYHLTRLETANLLNVESRGLRRVYEATDALRKAVSAE